VQRLDELEAKFTGELPETSGDAVQVLMGDPGDELASLDVSLLQAEIGMGAAPGLTLARKLRALRTSLENFRAEILLGEEK